MLCTQFFQQLLVTQPGAPNMLLPPQHYRQHCAQQQQHRAVAWQQLTGSSRVGQCVHPATQQPCAPTRSQSRPTPVATAASSRSKLAAPKSVIPEAAAASRVLFVGGLPAQVAAEELQQQLLALCAAAGCTPTRVQVAPFDDEAQRSRFPEGWLHKGFGLVAFQDEASVGAVAAAISCQAPDWGASAVLGPAKQVPADWPAPLTYTAEELTALQQQQAALDRRREHNRRQRQRQSQRLVDSVGQLLSSLQQPFGAAAAELYQPLLSQQAVQQLAAAAAAAAACNRGSDSSSSNSSWALPPRLHACLRWPTLLQLLQDQQQQQQDAPAAGPIQLAASVPEVERQLLLDWSQVPRVLDPAFGGRLADADVVRAGKGRMNLRALRKRVQVESFALLLWQLTQQTQLQHNSSSPGATTTHVVEFGSGSGNLVLPLAHLFPGFAFTAVDMKPSAVQLLQERVQQAGLTNVQAQLGRIEDFSGPIDVVLALHACGSATDWALEQAAARRAAFIVSPCCIGKINNRHSSTACSSGWAAVSASAADKELRYPRSQQLQQQLQTLALQVQQELETQEQPQELKGDRVLSKLQRAVLDSGSATSAAAAEGLFSVLAATADYSHQEQHSHHQLAALAKTNVEWDRGLQMREAAGYTTRLVRLLQPELTAKSDVLVGCVLGGG